MKYKISNFNLLLHHSPDEYLVFNTYTTSFLKINKNTYNQIAHNIEDNFFVEDNIDIIEQLNKLGLIILSSIDEKAIIKIQNRKWRENSEIYSVSIVPNIDCNFRCKYCFEDISSQYMTDQVVSSIERYFLKKINSNEIESLRIGWYGGEPLLSKRVIERLSKTFIKVKYYKSVIFTNGYSFTDNFIHNLRKYGISVVHITIDGPKEIHDSYRVHNNGKSTFDKIFDNISKIVLFNNDEISINIRTNLNNGNIKHYGNLLNAFKKIKSKKISFQFHKIHEVGTGIGTNYCGEPSEEEYEGVSRSAMEELVKYKFRKPSDFLPKDMNCQNCSAGHVNGFAINHDGLVYKCLKDINPANNAIGMLNDEGDIIYKTSEYIKWNKYDYSENELCKNCIILPVCMGGCIHRRLGLTPNAPAMCNKEVAIESIRKKVKEVYRITSLKVGNIS